MSLPKHYDPQRIEPQMAALWEREHVYELDPESGAPVYAIDTPPPTVSGNLHLGHVYSYTHTDLLARFHRMLGENVYYPMGFDDNGLPTERLVEKREGVTASQIGREAFIARCLAISEAAEHDYRTLWQRLGLSIDWRYTYRTIGDEARRLAQWSFLDLFRKELAYRQDAPAIWCPECRTAIAQADLDDLERETTFYTLAFRLEDGAPLPIATTRPELLPACVAVFVHPDDARYRQHIGEAVTTPLGASVPLLADPLADPSKGTGAVMCCTFGDTTDIEWWRTHHLPLRIIIGRDGRMTKAAGEYADLSTAEARQRIITDLEARGLLLGREAIIQSVRVHERCDTPVEYLTLPQWFIRALDFKAELLAAGERITWHPAHMGERYRDWVENLKWDWCVSRQRTFGVPFPLWYCDACGTVALADEAALPLDPISTPPSAACAECGGRSFTPERDVMDTWATSSLSPQIAGRFFSEPALYARVFPFTLRPQAHEIIRTWAFYTILKSLHHFGALPWTTVAISGWGLAPQGSGKISKSRGGGPIAPMAMLEKYSADAARYWASSTGAGKDSVISEEKMATGMKLAAKLWNVARFAKRFIGDGAARDAHAEHAAHLRLTPTDRWLLSRAERLIQRMTALMRGAEWAAAKAEVEAFFWRELADNYLELAKGRLYDATDPGHAAAVHTLRSVLLAVLKLFAPFLPYVTEAIYQALFAETETATTEGEGFHSIHRARWPQADESLISDEAEATGEALLAVTTAVRRYKSERGLSLGAELARLQLATLDAGLASALLTSTADLRSVTRAHEVIVAEQLDPALEEASAEGAVRVGIAR
jgi:valyl-tRNA synthetase